MRLFVLSLLALLGGLYAFQAVECYREEQAARSSIPLAQLGADDSLRHPEANLRLVRESLASGVYTDDLKRFLERAVEQAPSFYQPSFLLAAFYANRLEQPALIEQAFEEAIARFPSNGRLHLTYAEWMLTPRATAPYRAYRTSDVDPETTRRRAFEHIATATRLEPDLDHRTAELLVRFHVPLGEWSELLPPGDSATRATLSVLDRAPSDSTDRRSLLEKHLATTSDALTLRTLERYADRWGEDDLALTAAEKWRELAIERALGDEITDATLRVAQHHLERGELEETHRVIRSTLDSLDEHELFEDGVDLLVGMGSIYLGRKRVAMAESLFTEAAALSPYRAPAHIGLARAHQLAGERDRAMSAARRALEIEPANLEAQSILEALSEETRANR